MGKGGKSGWLLAFRVMDGSARTMPDQQARLQHAGKRDFDGIAAGPGGGDDRGHRDAGLLGEKLADRPGQRRERGERLLFRIQTAQKPVFLCLEGFE